MTDNAEPVGKHGFLVELSRRHVWRAAVLYGGAAWALSQGIAQLGRCSARRTGRCADSWSPASSGSRSGLHSRGSTRGHRKVSSANRKSSVPPALTRATGRKPDFAIIGVMTVVIVLLASGYLVRRSVPVAAPHGTAGAELFDPPVDTFAVLPFANESGDPQTQ